jgi:hypothetical protein
MTTLIERTGTVSFGDASLSIWEEGISAARAAGGYQATNAWEREFKHAVFARIVQTLNRLGWTCVMPEIDPHSVNHYGGDVARWSAESKRDCVKGDLKGHLDISGRCIKFEMWQDVTPPTNRNGGRYDFDKEDRMPYVLRLEMERTRRRIRDYLCNVFAGYSFNDKSGDGRSAKKGLMYLTAMEWIAECYRTSCHFKGDWEKYLAAHSSPSVVACFNSNRKSGDGALLEHGQKVWCFDYHGRIQQGTAYYNINNMWWVVLGRYDVTNKAGSELFTSCPDNPRVKRNSDLRRKRLEKEMARAVQAMKFERAAELRDVLFPGDPVLFNVWHNEHQLFHRAGFSGYTADQSKAGKFTADEVRGWDREPNRVIQIVAEKEAA